MCDATVQPGPSRLPLALHRGARDALSVSDILERQATEEPQLRHLALSLIERCELGQGGVQIQEVDVGRVALRDRFLEGHAGPPAGPFGGLAAPRVVYQNPAHHLRGHREEVRSILPVRMAANKSKVRLVYEGGRLQDVPWPFMSQSGGRPAAKLLMDDRDELVARSEIAATPCTEQISNIVIRTVQLPPFDECPIFEDRNTRVKTEDA